MEVEWRAIYYLHEKILEPESNPIYEVTFITHLLNRIEDKRRDPVLVEPYEKILDQYIKGNPDKVKELLQEVIELYDKHKK